MTGDWLPGQSLACCFSEPLTLIEASSLWRFRLSGGRSGAEANKLHTCPLMKAPEDRWGEEEEEGVQELSTLEAGAGIKDRCQHVCEQEPPLPCYQAQASLKAKLQN